MCKNYPSSKDGDLSDINNFRPIAILPVVSKILEHLVHNQTMLYLEQNNILDIHQGGFKKNHSTTSTTAEVLDDIYSNINNHQLTYATFIDFRKAFDSINHNILLKKLSKVGFQENTIKWYKNYLTSRTQFVTINNQKSNSLEVTCGVPEGSVLGPMLFLIFINDLGKNIESSNYKLYADDTVLYSKPNPNDVELRAHHQRDLDNTQKWCTQNAILMNVKKTKSMSFGTRQRLRDEAPPVFSIDGRLLESVPHYKYLGTFVDSELNFTRQAIETTKLVSYKLYFLSKIKRYLNTDSLIRLYKAYIQPYFDYNDIFLENCHYRPYDKLASTLLSQEVPS